MTAANLTPICPACLGGIHFAGEPDFPWRPTNEGEDCGAADHEALTEDDGEPAPPSREYAETTHHFAATLSKGATTASLIDLGLGLYLIRLDYPRRAEDDTGDIDDETLVGWIQKRLNGRCNVSVDTLRWEATERATTTGTIVDLAMCFYAED